MTSIILIRYLVYFSRIGSSTFRTSPMAKRTTSSPYVQFCLRFLWNRIYVGRSRRNVSLVSSLTFCDLCSLWTYSMTLGGVNSQFFSGAINYIPAPTRAFWTIQLDNIILGSSKSLGINFANVNIDTGTTNIYMPLHAATTLFNAIPGSQSVGYGLYTIPCK